MVDSTLRLSAYDCALIRAALTGYLRNKDDSIAHYLREDDGHMLLVSMKEQSRARRLLAMVRDAEDQCYM